MHFLQFGLWIHDVVWAFVEDGGLGFKVGLGLVAHPPDMVPHCPEATAVVADTVEVGMAVVPAVG